MVFKKIMGNTYVQELYMDFGFFYHNALIFSFHFSINFLKSLHSNYGNNENKCTDDFKDSRNTKIAMSGNLCPLRVVIL